jgi:uncharacterized protein (DUF1778 family)
MTVMTDSEKPKSKVRRKSIQFSIRTDNATKARVEQAAGVAQMTVTEFVEQAVRGLADEVLARHEQILLTDRDFQLFEALMTHAVEPNTLVRSEVAAFREGRFDAEGRYHW